MIKKRKAKSKKHKPSRPWRDFLITNGQRAEVVRAPTITDAVKHWWPNVKGERQFFMNNASVMAAWFNRMPHGKVRIYGHLRGGPQVIVVRLSDITSHQALPWASTTFARGLGD